MSILKGFWQFLTNEETPWGELAEKGIDAVSATKDLGDAFKEQSPHIQKLKPYLSQVKPFLEMLDSPVTQLTMAGLPFVTIGISLLRIYLDKSKIPPTYESSAPIAAQLAYLQSFETVLTKVQDEAIKIKLEQLPLQKLINKQLDSLDAIAFSFAEAKTITNRFCESELAIAFNNVLSEQLQQINLETAQTQRLVDQVMWGTHRYLHKAIAEGGDSLQTLADLCQIGGDKVYDRYDNIDAYLKQKIVPLPDGQIFDETDPPVQFRHLYVPLKVKLLTQSGEVRSGTQSINIHDWALGLLEQPDKPRKVMFVEGEAGRGKSVFCRMFANLVLQELEFAYIPLLIRLRDIRVLANNLTETLATSPALEQEAFVQGHPNWLADKNTRFLIILDGFDELLLQDKAMVGLQEFLQQVAAFQQNSHHQCIVTGRPLALQGLDRLITQTQGLERVCLEPMEDNVREQWLTKWQSRIGEPEVTQFRSFLEACPDEISNELAREPLLLYLLARLHRERYLTREMFADVKQNSNQRIQAKLRVYRESVNWVLEKQRQDENLRLSGLEDLQDLREVLQEAALCVMQSGNETAQLSMLKSRFLNTANPVAKWMQEAQETTAQSDDRALNNFLTTFYLKPGEKDKRGSVEFAHKSFGEYLFAERLMLALEQWTELDSRRRFRMNDVALYGEIYDLLGYGGLSVEVVEYLCEFLNESSIEQVKLFERLQEFYHRWCEGEFVDQPPNQNVPQKKMLQLKDQDISIGLKQVDIFAGLNVIILLFKLHAAAQPDGYPHLPNNVPAPVINFRPCGEPDTETHMPKRLLIIIHYADSIGLNTFQQLVCPHLSKANLSNADLYSANLRYANLSKAKLDNVCLRYSDLSHADLSHSALVNVIMTQADIRGANFSNANLEGAYLEDAYLIDTNFERSNLFHVVLGRAYLHNANLSNANLQNANLCSADCKNANLRHANLCKAKLKNADVSNVILDGAIMLETELIGVINLENSQLTSETPPFVCGSLLPSNITCDPNRDCSRVLPALRRKYPEELEAIRAAEKLIHDRLQARG